MISKPASAALRPTIRRYVYISFLLIVSLSARGHDSHIPDSTTSVAVNDTVNLKEVSVTAQAHFTSNKTIGRVQLEALPSNNVADALKYMAGVQIKDYGGLGGQKTINVRSLGSQHVGVYLDGVRITNVQNGTVDLGKFSLSTLESVSLFNGNKTDMLMTASEYASASTVYLRTRRPQKSSLTASGTYGSFNTYKADLTLSWKNYILFDADFTHSKGNYPFSYHTEYEDTVGTRRNSDITMFRVEGVGYYRGFQLHSYYFNSQRGLPGGIVRRLSDLYTDVGREWDSNFFTQLTYVTDVNRVSVKALVKYANDYLHYRSDYPENISVHSNNRYRQQDIYSAASVAYRYKDLGASASVDVRWADLVTDVRNYSYVYRLDTKASLAVYYTRNRLSVTGSGLYTCVTDHTRGCANPLRRFTWTAMSAWRLSRSISLRAFYKSVFRAPTLNDLYYTLVGNRNLRPEYTRQLNVGMTLINNRIELNCDAYFNRVIDRIVCLPLKGSYQWTMLNYGLTRCLGVDVSATVKLPLSSLLLNVTFQDDRNMTDPADDAYRDFIAYSPRWSLTGVYTINVGEFYGSLSHMFVDRRYWTAENAIEPPLSAYNCTDIKIGWRHRAVNLEIECQDLFDIRYELIQRWPMPGRRFAATFKIKI